MLKLRNWAIIFAVTACASSAAQASEPDSPGIEFFEKHIRPLLVDQCYECHSTTAKKVKGRLLLDSREGMLRGGEGGIIIVPGSPEKSRLVAAIKYSDPDLQMPPKHQLKTEQIAAFEQWIRMGAPDPRIEARGKAVPAIARGPFMMNDPLMEEPAGKLADRITLAKPDEPGRIDCAFRLCFDRPAGPEEIHSAQSYLLACGGKLAEAGVSPGERDRRAMISYMHVLLSSDEFIFLD